MSAARQIPEPYISVVRRQMNGVPNEQIANELNLPVSEVERLGREGQRIGAEILADPEVQAESARRWEEARRSSADRVASARQLLSSESFLTVEHPEDPELLEPSAAAAFVWFSDIAAHDFDDLVDETVVVLRSRPDVEAAHREDRELIIVSGRAEIETLQHDLRSWWRQRLHQEFST